MDKETHSSKPPKPTAEEKPFDLAPDVLAAIQLVQQKAWPILHGPPTTKADHARITVQVPFSVRRDVLTFFTALFHVLNIEVEAWFQRELEHSLVAMLDSHLDISDHNRKILVAKITSEEEETSV